MHVKRLSSIIIKNYTHTLYIYICDNPNEGGAEPHRSEQLTLCNVELKASFESDNPPLECQYCWNSGPKPEANNFKSETAVSGQ